MNSKKILITGAKGFIGSHLGNMLVEKGFEVVGVDNNSHPSLNTTNFTILNQDVCKADVKGFDVIFHLAAHINVDESLKDPVKYFDNNVGQTLSILENVRLHNSDCLFIFASSAEVYGSAQSVPMGMDHPLAPASPYAETKKTGENICKLYERIYGINIRIVRNFNAFGAFQRDGEYGGVISKFKSLARQGKDLPVYGSGEQMRDYSDVNQFIHGYFLAATSKAFPETIHYGSGSPVKIIDIARYISKRFGVGIRHEPERRGEIAILHADISEAVKHGYKSEDDFWQKLETYLNL
jgi:nucleoside-diphosphate-sugar epimerase